MTNHNKKTPKILIVDDVPQNIQVLANILKEEGYQMGFAKDGKTALTHTQSTQFDLILLDIMMPEMDGYEVCKRLKKDKRKKDIPVIFITAKDEISDKTKGFELGAVDYITKPFDAREVLARVKTHLTLRNYTIKLEQIVQERTRQLIHADRLATLGTFSAAIAHEINNPLSYIMGDTKLLRLFWNSAKSILETHAAEKEIKKVLKQMESVDEKLESILNGSYRISRLVNSLRTYSRQSDVPKKKFLLMDIINDALDLISHKLKFARIIVKVRVPDDLMVWCNQQKLSQVFINLVNNACDAMAKQQGGKIIITATSRKDHIEIDITDNGPGIPDEIADKIFDPFFTTKGKDEGTGLGLFIVNNIIEEHQGKISLAPSKGKGARFHIVLPQV